MTGATRGEASLAAPPTARRRIVVGVLLAAVITAAAAAWLGTRAPANVPFSVASQVPADAQRYAWIESLDGVVDLAAGLSTRMPGSEGLVEALSVLAGVDLADNDAVARSGLQLGTGAVLFEWRGAFWAALGLRDVQGARHVVDLLGRRGHAVEAREAAAGVDQRWHVRTRGDQPLDIDRGWRRQR